MRVGVDIELAAAPDVTRVPTEFRILRPGLNETRNGDVMFDEEAAGLVMSEFEKGGVDLPIDLNHAMADMFARPKDHAALGWFRPEVRDGELWATDVTWTEEGREAVESRAWRYTSLWGNIAPVDPSKTDSPYRLVRLHTVSVVNRPATLKTLPLVAGEGANTEAIMSNQLSPVAIHLSAASEAAAVDSVRTLQDTVRGVVEALKLSSPSEVSGALQAVLLRAEKADALEAELAEVRTKALEAEKDALIATLSDEKKLSPAMQDWARAQSVDSLKAFAKVAPVLTAASEQVTQARGDHAAAVTLSDEDVHIARLLGSDLEAVKAEKARSIRG